MHSIKKISMASSFFRIASWKLLNSNSKWKALKHESYFDCEYALFQVFFLPFAVLIDFCNKSFMHVKNITTCRIIVLSHILLSFPYLCSLKFSLWSWNFKSENAELRPSIWHESQIHLSCQRANLISKEFTWWENLILVGILKVANILLHNCKCK